MAGFAAEPDQRAKRGTGRRIADRLGIGRLGSAGPLDHQPDGASRQPVLTYGHAVTRKVILNWPFGPFRDCPPIPLPRWQGRGQSRDALRGAGGRTQVALRPLCALIPIDLLLGGRPLRPTTQGDRIILMVLSPLENCLCYASHT